MQESNGALNIASRRGIYYQAFGIYGGAGGFYDYGPAGLRIKRKIENLWRRSFIDRLGAMEIETTTITILPVLKASGHVDTFTDPVAVCSRCKSSYRVDKLLEEAYSASGNEEGYESVKKMKAQQMGEKVKELGIKCAKCGGELGGIEAFNLMFKTEIGHGSGEVGYLRPETAQGIFVDFKELYRIHGFKLPYAISQAGRAYRNEISPRQQLVRMREFTQMETELFFNPKKEQRELGEIGIDDIKNSELLFAAAGEKERMRKIGELLEKKLIPNFYFAVMLHIENGMLERMGFPRGRFRFRQLEPEELPHYSKGNVDLEVNTSYGYIEVAGNAYRTDYDIASHARNSNTEICVNDDGEKVVPHVVEASMGLDRLLFSILDCSATSEGREWEWLKLGKDIAPYTYAVFPLQKDEKIVAFARKVLGELTSAGIDAYYSDTGSIGKRYARADEIGVAYCITADFQSLDDGSFTVRDRDSAKQDRKRIGDVVDKGARA